MRKIKGSVTLFVAMIFLLVITVIMTVITSARIQGAGIMVSTSVSCSLDSVFAGYDKELFDKFGVLLFKGEDKETVISQLNGYLKDNIENDHGQGSHHTCRHGLYIVHGISAGEGRDTYRKCEHLVTHSAEQRPQVVVPASDEGKDTDRCNDGF